MLVSGTGSNLQALLDELHPAVIEIVGVASSRADAQALARAAAAGVPAASFDLAGYRGSRGARCRDGGLARRARRVAGRLRGLHVAPDGGVPRRAFPGRVINVHPSLLPAFPGRAALEDALAAGVRETGVTVFVVDDGVDTGPVLAQQRIPVEYDDRLATLRARIQAVEHRLLPETVRAIAEGRISL